MWQLLAMITFAQTQVIDDPFEQSVIYVTPLDAEGGKAQIVYADANNCSFLQLSDRSFASQRQRGAREASSFLELRLTAIYKELCGDPLQLVDVTKARFLGGLEADVDVKPISSHCALTMCKGEYSVSVRMTSGMSARDNEVALKFGAPHSQSFVIRFPLQSYKDHRKDVLK